MTGATFSTVRAVPVAAVATAAPREAGSARTRAALNPARLGLLPQASAAPSGALELKGRPQKAPQALRAVLGARAASVVPSVARGPTRLQEATRQLAPARASRGAPELARGPVPTPPLGKETAAPILVSRVQLDRVRQVPRGACRRASSRGPPTEKSCSRDSRPSNERSLSVLLREAYRRFAVRSQKNASAPVPRAGTRSPGMPS